VLPSAVCGQNMIFYYWTFFCILGPALLFERYVSTESLPRRYYACSACRSRKECQFFQWADRQKSQKQSLVNHQEQEDMYQQLHKASFSRQEISYVFCISVARVVGRTCGVWTCSRVGALFLQISPFFIYCLLCKTALVLLNILGLRLRCRLRCSLLD